MAQAQAFRCEGDYGRFHFASLAAGQSRPVYNYLSPQSSLYYLPPDHDTKAQMDTRTRMMEQYTSSQAQEPCQQWLDLQNRSGSGIEHLNNMTSSCTPDQSYTAQDRGLSTYDASFAHEIAPRCDLDADQVQSLHAQSLLDNANLWYNTADVVDIMPYSTEQLEDSKQSWGLRGCVGQYPDTTPDVPDLDTTQSLSPKSLRIETPMGNSPVTPKASTSVSSMGKYWPQHSTAGLVAADTSLYHDVQPADTMGNSGHQIFGAGYGDYTQSQMKSDSSSQLLNTPGHGLPIPVSPDTAQCQSNFTRGHYDTVSPTWHGDDKRAMLRQQLQLQQTVSQTNYQPQQHFGLHSSAAVSSAQQDFQARRRTTFTRPVDEDDMRKVDDQILLEGKKRNLTYKEIAKQMSLKCAESTLRGRYRSLTKPRHHRVRRPRWMPVDIQLLEAHVQLEFRRIDQTFPSLDDEQRLRKVQWKKVADAIAKEGGTYHFGNSTCKRKWVELHPEINTVAGEEEDEE